MFNPTFSPTINIPENVQAVDSLFLNYDDDPLIFAGGTHIMRTVMDYPNGHFPQLVDITKIVGFDTFVRTEKTVEIGAVNTLSHLHELGEPFFEDAIKLCLSSGAPEVVKRKATLGGAIAADGVYYNIVAPLIHYNASVEVHFYKGNMPGNRIQSLASIYDETEPRLIEPLLITKVIIPYTKHTGEHYSYYREVGSPIVNPSDSIVFVGTFTSDEVTNNISINATVLFADVGFFSLSETNQTFQVTTISSFEEIEILREEFKKAIEDKFNSDDELICASRLEKTLRIFEDFLLSVSERLV